MDPGSKEGPPSGPRSSHIASLSTRILPNTSRRHRTASLVCHRWRRLVNAPALLHDAMFMLRRTGAEGRLQLLSFLLWLARHGGGHVRSLNVDVDGASQAAAAEILDMCGVELGWLEIRTHPSCDGSCSWMGLEGMTKLWHLRIGRSGTEDSIHMDVDLGGLPRLRNLELFAADDELATLPPSVTHVVLDGYRGYHFTPEVTGQLSPGTMLDMLRLAPQRLKQHRCLLSPPQIAALPRLERLIGALAG